MKKRNGLSYGIAFDTKEMPGKVVAVTVALTKEVIGTDDSVRVDLSAHPLYRHLVEYVLSNPPSRPKGEIAS